MVILSEIEKKILQLHDSIIWQQRFLLEIRKRKLNLRFCCLFFNCMYCIYLMANVDRQRVNGYYLQITSKNQN